MKIVHETLTKRISVCDTPRGRLYYLMEKKSPFAIDISDNLDDLKKKLNKNLNY